MLQGNGFEVVDMGVDVTPEKFIDAVERRTKRNLIALSALLTTTDARHEAGRSMHAGSSRRPQRCIKVMIGGAPVTQKFSDEIKADGYAPDAASAVDLAKQLLGVAVK